MVKITEKHISFKNRKNTEKRDQEIFDWIFSFYQSTEKLPTLKEIALNFNFSKERARQIMERLIEKGYFFKNRKQGWRTTYIFNPDYFKNL